MSIDSRQLTVILQGPLSEAGVDIATRAFQSVQQYLPQAQIILSTTDSDARPQIEGAQWVEGSSAPHFDDINGNINNVNKLITTMANGLALAEREYCLKLRTDHVLFSDVLLTLMGTDLPAQLFGACIGVSNLFLRNPTKLPYLFHLTDTLQFGRTEDLRKLWSIGTLPADYVYLKKGPRTNPIGTFQGYTSFRLLPEQAIFLRFAQKNGLALDLAHISHTTFRLFSAWEDLLLDNFDVHDWKNLGVLPPARFLSRPYAPESVMTERDVRRMRAHRSCWSKALRYAQLLLNKYVLCGFRRRWLVSAASLLLFSFAPEKAITARNLYRRLTGAQRV
ncbi:WavE lipopolysaccharide synthesis family protein [Pseudomonas aeruginosa]|uniref:WavE lipopolysaccharide synthesis family protein n=1 Tax=Pseudomonas aeruginosa TaxID=287 RepID=UPI001F42ABD0|nr:WavE lipopolysaccharide synthesis family protein [Pseudomonas aeruginosa]